MYFAQRIEKKRIATSSNPYVHSILGRYGVTYIFLDEDTTSPLTSCSVVT
jgi:hypothetical protein